MFFLTIHIKVLTAVLHGHRSCALLWPWYLQLLLWPLAEEDGTEKVVAPVAVAPRGLGKEALVIVKGLVDALGRAGLAIEGPGWL